MSTVFSWLCTHYFPLINTRSQVQWQSQNGNFLSTVEEYFNGAALAQNVISANVGNATAKEPVCGGMHYHTSHYLRDDGGSGKGGGNSRCSLGPLWTAERVLLPPTASVLRTTSVVKTGLSQLLGLMSLSTITKSWKQAIVFGCQ